jgi:hypothetical protein
LRFTRDKAGYENTYVVESDRRRGRSRTRVLYWFRTPPGVKVGRAALDEDAIRRIEELNPGMEFDWPRILKGQGVPATEPRPQAETRRQRPDNRRSQPNTAPQAAPAPRPLPPRPAAESPRPRPDVPPEAEPVQVSESSESPATDVVAAIADEVPTPAHARIGAAGVQQLRARYADLVTRIAERTDETRRAELKEQADRLNPDSWVTDDQVSQGLEQYESVLASLREVAGQKRRRRRRGKGPRPASAGTGATAAEPDDSLAEDADEPESSPHGDAEPGES